MWNTMSAFTLDDASYFSSRILVTILNELVGVCFFWWEMLKISWTEKSDDGGIVHENVSSILIKTSWLQIIIFSLFNRSRAGIFSDFVIWKIRWQRNCSGKCDQNSHQKKTIIFSVFSFFLGAFECACPRGFRQTFRGYFSVSWNCSREDEHHSNCKSSWLQIKYFHF